MTAITDIKIVKTDAPKFICSVWTPKHGWVCEDTDECTDANPHGFWSWANLLETAVTGDGDFWLDNIKDVRISRFHKGKFTDATDDFVKEATEIWANGEIDTHADDLKVPLWMYESLARAIVEASWREYRFNERHIRQERTF